MEKQSLQIESSQVHLYNADCLEVLQSLPDSSVNVIVTDPPYNIKYSNTHSVEEYAWDNMSDNDFIDFTSNWLKECYRILTPTGTCWTFFGRTNIQQMFQAVGKTLFQNNLENWITFARTKGRGASTKLKSLAEEIFHLTKSETYTWNSCEVLRRVIAPYTLEGGEKRGWDYGPDGKTPLRFTGVGNIMAFCSDYHVKDDNTAPRGTVLDLASGELLRFDGVPSDVMFINTPSYNNTFEKQQHSAQKPVLLNAILIMIASEQKQTILDCFMGSGSSCVASVLAGRNYIGIEREKETYQKAYEWITHIDRAQAKRYIKAHVSSNEKKFEFGMDTRFLLAKEIK